MNANSRFSIFVCWILAGTMFLSNLSSLAQENLGRQTILQFDANHALFRADAPELKESTPLVPHLNNPYFFSGVGGVSFDKVARPEEGFAFQSISITYIPGNPDGKRCEWGVDGKNVAIDLPDWLLIPIANYAESPFYSCVTLFGKLKDKNLEKALSDHEGHVINYHPAFDNTLLGIRLAYTDMLMIRPFTSDLPKNSKGEYILGLGESPPAIQKNEQSAIRLRQFLNKIEDRYGTTFRSYVISDCEQDIRFGISNDSMVITGHPYYYFWKFNRDLENYNIQSVADNYSNNYLEIIKQLRESGGEEEARKWLISKLIGQAERYKGNYNFYSDGTFIDLIRKTTKSDKEDMLSKYQTSALFEIVVTTETYMNRDSIIYLEGFSKDISSQQDLMKGANPAVYDATQKTLCYAAFFRYLKAHYPEKWRLFLSQIRNVTPQPFVTTPTIMYDPDSRSVQEAVQAYKTRKTK